MSEGVEWALHCCVVMTGAEQPAPAAKLAVLHDVSGSYLAKHLQQLARAGIVRSVQGGHAGGYALTRAPETITVLDVVEAIDGRPAFQCTEIRQRGPLATPEEACVKPCPIARVMSAADEAWRASLRAVTIADLAREVEKDSGPAALARVGAWLRGE